MLGALYRVANDETLKVKGTDELKILANEVMAHLQKTVDTNLYLQVYNSIHLKIQHVRQERKNQRSIQVIAILFNKT
jgi:hypothetical protein